MTIKSILVAIHHPHERQQLGLARAAQLARRAGARLRLFHSTFYSYAAGPQFAHATIAQGIDKALAEDRAALEKLALPLRRSGLQVSVEVSWDYPAHESIVREVLRSKPDLVVAESHRHTRGARLFLSNTDWQLIRLCPAPLLFVKQHSAYGRAQVLAAVDPLHHHDKPARLDQQVVDYGATMAALHGGRLDVIHAYLPVSQYLSGPLGEPLVVPIDPRIEAQQQKRIDRAMSKLVAPLSLPRNRVHVSVGTPESAIVRLARASEVDLVVMGAVSRRGLERVFIGSTAERIIDRLTCDVLIVKPSRFKTPVSRRSVALQLILPPL
jgi:universal stress protein E